MAKRSRLSKKIMRDHKFMRALVRLKRKLHAKKFRVSLVERKAWGGFETKVKWFDKRHDADAYADVLAKSVRGDSRFYTMLQSTDESAVFVTKEVR